MRRTRNPYPADYELKACGEPSLRELAEMCAKEAEQLEHEAAIARENARIYLEAAEARAAEKAAWKEQRRALRQAARNSEAR
jgi:hypothetical protein